MVTFLGDPPRFTNYRRVCMRYFSSAAILGIVAGIALLVSLRIAPAADDDKSWGTLKGRIVFAGDKLPEPEELKVDKDQQHCLEKGKLYSGEWVVNKDNKGIRWVLVWL